MTPSLAQQRLILLGVSPTLGPYTREDAQRVLAGHAVDPKVRDTVHNKLAWVVGSQLIRHINGKQPGLRWTPDRFAVRTIDHGEASASFLSFPDGSHLVLVSRVLQETLIALANVVEYCDVSASFSRLHLRRSKRERLKFETAARVTGILRYLLITQRFTGRAPQALADLPRRSADLAGELAAAAVMFVIAHEIGHIAFGHADLGVEVGPVIQELQADDFAFGLLQQLMTDNPETVFWSAFIALFARQLLETAIYIRRSQDQTHAFARWGVLEQEAGAQDERHALLRLGVMAGVAGALERRDAYPADLWSLLWKDKMLSVDPAVTPGELARWDRLQTCPLDALAAEAEGTATVAGRMLLSDLGRGAMFDALNRLDLKPHVVDAMLDRSTALSFFALKRAIETATTQFTQGDALAFSVAGARLAAEHLKGDHVDDW